LFWSASIGALDIHELAGEGVLALVLFRLVWGVLGSQTARFSDFLGGFAAIQKYLVHRESKSVGHNPLGGWMVVAHAGDAPSSGHYRD
jgi:cytochrome b